MPGDWITVAGGIEGEVIEINWRATRIKSASNDMTVIPNSVVAKAIVTNHRRLNDPHLCTLALSVDHRIPPVRVIDALQTAAKGSPGVASGHVPTAYACGFADSLVTYELSVPVDEFTLIEVVQSEVIKRVIDVFSGLDIVIGPTALAVRMVQPADRKGPPAPGAA